MTSLRRALPLIAVTFSLALSAPSAAMADTSFHSSFGTADAKGATLTMVYSHVGEGGKANYEYVTYTATMDGATVNRTISAAE